MSVSEKCAICLKNITAKQSKLKCDGCCKEFHASCCKMSKADLDCLSVDGLVWRCSQCACERRKSLRMDAQLLSGDLTLLDIMNELKEMKEDQKNSIKDFNCSYERLDEKLTENMDILKKQSEDLIMYREEIEKLKEENAMLKKKNVELEMRVVACEQYSRKNSIEIHGMPVTANENVLDIIKKVGSALDISIQDDMIDNCHRLGKRPDGGAPIIVKFLRRRDAEEVLKKRRVKRNLSTRHMGMTSDCPVYINESLCPAKRMLYSRVRVLKREKGFKYLWLRGGKILVRKVEGAPVIEINCQDDLDKL